MTKPHIKLKLIAKLGPCQCHHGHKIGDEFDFDTDRSKLCPMAMHSGFPFIDIIRYGGEIPSSKDGNIKFCCPDPDVANVFEILINK